jgi:hypothetical protein
MLVRIEQPEAVNLHPEEAGASGVLAGAVARVAGAVHTRREPSRGPGGRHVDGGRKSYSPAANE